MKTIVLAATLLIAGNVSTFAQIKEVDTEKSVVAWTGKKIGSTHRGEVKIQSGYFEFNDGKITDGKVIMDMTTMTNRDSEDASPNERLVGHLKSEDFFEVETYPNASFLVTGATGFNNGKATVTGEITIKEHTETMSFDVMKEGGVYTTQLNIDRSKFDVRYGSGSFFDNLGDKAIDDIFVLDIELVM